MRAPPRSLGLCPCYSPIGFESGVLDGWMINHLDGPILWAGSSDHGMTIWLSILFPLLQRSSRKSETESVGIYQNFERKPGVSGDIAPGEGGLISPRKVPTPH